MATRTATRIPQSPELSVPLAQISAGLTATLIYVFGPVSLYFATARAFGGEEVATSGFVVAFATSAAGTLLLSAWFRQPLALGWSLPGLLFMAASARTYPVEEITGAALIASLAVLAIAICGLSGKIEDLIPTRVAMALLAGSTINLCARPFAAMGDAPFIVAPVFAGFLLGRALNWTRLPPVTWAVLAGIGPALMLGPAPEYAAPGLFPTTHPFLPAISARAVLSLSPPLVMFALIANAQGRAVLRSNGFEAPSRPLGVTSGVIGAVHAFFGAPPASLQRVAMAVLSDEGAGRTEQRWVAASVAAMGCLVIAYFAVPLERLTSSLDPAFVTAVSGVLLIRVLSDALKKVVEGPSLAGPMAFCAATSGLALGGLSTEFWALAIGCAVAVGEFGKSKTPAL